MDSHEMYDVEMAEKHQTLPASPPPPSPPVQPLTDHATAGEEAVAAKSCKMHPVMKILEEKELGKVLLALAMAILGMVITGRDRLGQSETSAVLLPVTFGFTAIFYGIMLQDTFPRFSMIVGTVGIFLVSLSFFTIIYIFMPAEFSWAPIFCGVLLSLLFIFVLVWPCATG